MSIIIEKMLTAFTILSVCGFIIVAWVRFPTCAEGHVAAWAGPYTMTTWVCVRGYSPEWKGRAYP